MTEPIEVSGTMVANFAQKNAERIKDINRPVIRSQLQVFPNFLAYQIGRALGIRYQPIVQIIALDGRVFTETVEMLQ